MSKCTLMKIVSAPIAGLLFVMFLPFVGFIIAGQYLCLKAWYMLGFGKRRV
jgi:hypothetical protein